MKNRRNFFKVSFLGGLGILTQTRCKNDETLTSKKNIKSGKSKSTKPIVIATWDHGMTSNIKSWEILSKGGNALDAVEQGVRIVESDPEGLSVGIGGLPDREGKVTLDACIMNHKNDCGAVAFLEHIENPISVARKVMESTPHVMLVGEGAYQFAIQNGFKHRNLLTEKSKKAWETWLEKSKYQPVVNSENHDTIGALALDANGNLAGACTTSGMAYKLRGRVGDSPIIGAGLFVDNEVGAACATGVGEAIIRIAGSAIVVEMMRQGMSPQEACKAAVERVISKHSDIKDLQVGFLALSKNGEYGAYSIYNGFSFAVHSADQQAIIKSESGMFDKKYEEG